MGHFAHRFERTSHPGPSPHGQRLKCPVFVLMVSAQAGSARGTRQRIRHRQTVLPCSRSAVKGQRSDVRRQASGIRHQASDERVAAQAPPAIRLVTCGRGSQDLGVQALDLAMSPSSAPTPSPSMWTLEVYCQIDQPP